MLQPSSCILCWSHKFHLTEFTLTLNIICTRINWIQGKFWIATSNSVTLSYLLTYFVLHSELIKHFKHASNKQPATVEKHWNWTNPKSCCNSDSPPSSGSQRKAPTWERSLAFHFLVVDVEWAKASLQHNPGKYVLHDVWGDQSLQSMACLSLLKFVSKGVRGLRLH